MVFFWAGFIFTLSSFPTLPSAQKIWWDFIIKKIAHISEYAIFYYLVLRALNPRSPSVFLTSLILCLLYAISDEIHQSFIPGRHARIYDVYFDSLGLTFTLLRSQKFI